MVKTQKAGSWEPNINIDMSITCLICWKFKSNIREHWMILCKFPIWSLQFDVSDVCIIILCMLTAYRAQACVCMSGAAWWELSLVWASHMLGWVTGAPSSHVQYGTEHSTGTVHVYKVTLHPGQPPVDSGPVPAGELAPTPALSSEASWWTRCLTPSFSEILIRNCVFKEVYFINRENGFNLLFFC